MKSIARRLTVSLSLTVVLVSSIVISVIYLSSISKGQKELDNKADEIFTYLAGTLRAPVWNVNYNLVKIIGDTVVQNELVSELTIIDLFGAVIYQSKKESTINKISRSGKIIHYDQTVGEIYLSLTTESFKKSSRTLLIVFFTTIILILIALVVVTGFLIKTFLGKPIQRLDKIATAFAAGQYDLVDHDMPFVEFFSLYGVMADMGKRIKKQFQELGEAEKKYRNIFNTIEEGYILSDIQGKIISANPSAAKLLKYESPSLLEEKNMLTDICISPQYPSDLMVHFKTKGFLSNYLLRFRQQDGREIIVEANLRQTRDKDDSPVTIEGTFRDVTQRILMEDELKQHKTELEKMVTQRTAQLNATLDALPDILFEVNDQGRIFDFRVPSGKNMDILPEVFMGKRVRDILPQGASSKIESAIAQAKKEGSTFDRSFSMGMSDGLHWFDFSMAAKSVSGEEENRYVMLVRDITARVKNQRIVKTLFEISNAVNVSQDLKDLYLKIHEIIDQYIDTTNFGIALVNEEKDQLEFTYWVDEKDEFTSPILHISNPETKGLSLEVIRTQKPLFIRGDDLSEKLKKGELSVVGAIPAVWIGSPLAVGNKVIGVMVVQHYENSDHYTPEDVEIITSASEQVAMAIARKQMEHQMIEARKEAETASHAKSDFLARMSHEIRTPMNAIIGFSTLILGTVLTGKQKQYLERIHEASKSLLAIINDILDFSKIEAGKLVMEKIPFHLDTVLENVSNLVRNEAEIKELEFLLDVSPDLPLALIGDPLRLGQVLINLSSNAIKFTQKGKVIIRVEEEERKTGQIKIRFKVTDTGIGISPDRIDTLFKAFSQADSSTTRNFGGTGLGLAICHNLVRMMGGETRIESQPLKGSTFFFSVWFDRQATKEKKCYQPVGSLNNLKVLVVDDLSDSRQIFCNMMETFSFRADQAGSGQEGLDILVTAAKKNISYDLVILDYFMPDMDGITAGRKIMDHPELKPIPKIIMVSAHSREDIMLNASKTGLSTFLIKPVTHSVMFDAIHETFGLEAVRSRQHNFFHRNDSKGLENIKGARILLVEDNEINQQLALEILKQAGLCVTIASNGVEAVEAVDKTPYDLVLMDIEMPFMDGYQATEAIRAKTGFETLPILAVTAHAMASYKEKCIQCGMSDYLTKPIDQRDLFAKLIKWIPPGKREPVESQDEASSSPNGFFLPELEGFDIQAALERANQDHFLLARLLCQFKTKYQGADQEIQGLIKHNDLSQAGELSHAIKGVAGNLGATHLYQAATDLDLSLKNGSAPDWERQKKLADFTHELNRALDVISILETSKETTEMTPGEPDISAPVDLVACLEYAKRLDGLLLENDAGAVAVAQSLGQMTSKSKIQPLAQILLDLVEVYDFDGARDKLATLTNELEHLKD
ncbi:MAG: response regulator [Desulfobacteraceae bacterium]|nr:response regulator [Desulfobacteraceae bacterium]